MLYYSPSDVPLGEYRLPLGKANVRRVGTDVTVVAWGRLVNEAIAAAETLAGDGIEAEVVDLRTLVPLDLDTVLESVAKTRRVVVAHEAVRRAGYGAELAAEISEHLFGQLAGPVLRVAAPNTPVPFAKELETMFLPGAAAIIDACAKVTGHAA
jgi:pyruvate dehydrogenase E1 component beta subunit